ncbi:MAG: hypothetical protein ACI8RD_004908, partial [Bacillariaceae sp.]|jgi:hypothetical protein
VKTKCKEALSFVVVVGLVVVVSTTKEAAPKRLRFLLTHAFTYDMLILSKIL